MSSVGNVIIILRTNTSSGRTLRWRSGQIFSGQPSDFSSPALSLIIQSSWIRDTWEMFNSSLFMWCKHANGGISNINSHNIFTCEIEIRADCSKNHCSATHWRIYVTMRQKLLWFFLWFSKGKLKLSKHINFCRWEYLWIKTLPSKLYNCHFTSPA